jgi:hypothetical protein
LLDSLPTGRGGRRIHSGTHGADERDRTEAFSHHILKNHPTLTPVWSNSASDSQIASTTTCHEASSKRLPRIVHVTIPVTLRNSPFTDNFHARIECEQRLQHSSHEKLHSEQDVADLVHVMNEDKSRNQALPTCE